MDRVELIIALTGDKEAVSSLQSLEKAADKLKNTKIQLQIEKIQNLAEISKVQKQIDDLTSQKRKLELDVQAVKAAEKQIKALEAVLHEAQIKFNTKMHLRIEDAEAKELAKTIVDAQKRIEELKNVKGEIKVDYAAIHDINVELDAARDRLAELSEEKREIGIVMDGVDQATKGAEDIKQGFNGAAEAVQRVSGALSSLGGFMQSAASTINSVFGAFTKNNVIDTLERYATIMATNVFAGDWSKAVQRYDILETYPQYLQMMGATADEAAASIDKINANIQGIPVGLDTVAQQARLYSMYLNDDLETATDLAVGINRALIAGGGNESQKNGALQQIDRLLSTGSLDTIRQWRALFVGLGVSARYLREEMGYANLTQGEFIDGLKSGSIASEDLIQGLANLATSNRLNAAIEVYRGTIESGLSNIRFALTRGKANVIDALNDTLMSATGKDLSGWLYEVRDGINAVYAAIQNWIRVNPQAVASVIDYLQKALARLRQFDYASLVTSIGRALSRFIDIVLGVYDAIPEDLFEVFITFGMVWASPVAKGLNLVGGALKALGAVVGSGAITKFVNYIPTIAAGISTLYTAISSFGIAGVGTMFAGELAAAAAGITAIGAAVAAAFGAVYAIDRYNTKKIRQALGLDEIDAFIEKTDRYVASVNTRNDTFETEIARIESKSANAKKLLSEIVTLDKEIEALEKSSGSDVKSQKELADKMAELQTKVKLLNADFPQLNAAIDINTGHITAHTKAVAADAEAFVKALAAQAKAEAHYNRLPGLYDQQTEGQKALQENLRMQKDVADRLRTEQEKLNSFPDKNHPVYGRQRVVVEELKDAYSDLTEEGVKIVENNRSISSEINSTIGTIESLTNEANELSSVTETLANSQDDAVNAIGETKKSLEELQKEYDSARESAESFAAGTSNAFERMKQDAWTSLQEMTSILEHNRKATEDFYKNIEDVFVYSYDTDNVVLRDLLNEYVSSGPETAAYEVKALADAVNSGNYEAIESLVEAKSGLLDVQDKIADIKQVMDMNISLGEAGNWMEQGFFFDALEKPLENAARQAERYNAAMSDAIPGILKNKGILPDEAFRSRGNLEEQIVKPVRDAVTEVEEIINSGIMVGTESPLLSAILPTQEQIDEAIAVTKPQVEGMMNEIFAVPGQGDEEVSLNKSVSVDEDTISNTTELLNQLKETWSGVFSEMTASLNGEDENTLAGALASISTWLITATGETIPDFNTAIESVGSAIEAFSSGPMTDLEKKTKDASKETLELKGQILNLANMMDMKSGTIDAFAGKIQSLGGEANTAAESVRGLIEAINRANSMSIHTPGLNANANTGLLSRMMSTGGIVTPIYRAVGGGINWQKKGTDTVPAMLTPGEFVVRKKAVDKLGTPFMQMLNRLDIPNAVDALMSRVPHIGGQVFYNNQRTYDSHNVVNQTIHTNNPAYSYRRASRWVNALG